MKCPKCKSRTYVKDVRWVGTCTWRVRECPKCGYRFKTTERFLDEMKRRSNNAI